MAKKHDVVEVSNELDVVIQPKNPIEFDTNFDELKRELKKKLRKYKGLKVEDKNFDHCKLVQKQCVASRNLLENRRREAMKAFIELPKNKLQASFEELQKLIAEVEDNIKVQMNVYEEERIEDLTAVLEEYVEELQSKYDLLPQFKDEVVLVKKYFNKTAKEKDTLEDIERQFKEQALQQKAYFTDIALVRDTVKGKEELINVDKYLKLLESGSMSSSEIVMDIKEELERLSAVIEEKVVESQETVGKPAESSFASIVEGDTQEDDPEEAKYIRPINHNLFAEIDSLAELTEDDLSGNVKSMKIKLEYPEEMGKLIKAFFESFEQINIKAVR